MRWGQQVVGLVAVCELENVVAVFFPAVGGLVWLARQQRRQVDFLSADRRHLLAYDAFDFVEDAQAQREPGEDARSFFADVAGPDEELGGIDVLVGRRVAQGAQKQARHAKWC